MTDTGAGTPLTAEERRQEAVAQSLADAGLTTAGRRTTFLTALESRGYVVRPATDPAGLTHPHDGYAYDGCTCTCCTNVRAFESWRPA